MQQLLRIDLWQWNRNAANQDEANLRSSSRVASTDRRMAIRLGAGNVSMNGIELLYVVSVFLIRALIESLNLRLVRPFRAKKTLK